LFGFRTFSCGPRYVLALTLNWRGRKSKRFVIAPGLFKLLFVAMKTFAEMNFPGRLIAVEGVDGSGKSTQIYLLKRWLELQQLKVYFSEWNSSELVKAATSKGKKRELLTPTTFSLIHATDFADRYERHLVPLLRAGYLVLCDRYIFTAFARDVVRGCPPEWVRGNYSFAALPDLTFFFKADLEVSLQRILDGRPQLKYFEAGMDLRLSTDPYESFRIFQGRMLEQYLSMSTEFGFLVMDANQLVEKQQAIVRELIAQKLDLARFRRAERPPAVAPRKPKARLTAAPPPLKRAPAEELVE
jgi:dTMP kinase